MTTSESFRALRRANPRTSPEFAQSVEAAAHAVRDRLAAPENREAPPPAGPRRRLAALALAGAILAAAAAAALLATESTTRGPGVENATAAVRRAATATAASARRSGTAIVRITHDGRLWAGTTIRWHGGDLAVENDAPHRSRRPGGGLLLVNGTLYGFEAGDGGWVVLGSPASIDPDSGTTPAEYLAAVREDAGGTTLRRIADGLSNPTTSRGDDGSTVYGGAVPAGLIARETGFKEGRRIRVLPFGYVAHDEAYDPRAPVDVALTVGPDGAIRELAATWGPNAAWSYTVSYSNLGSTPAPTAPANARPFPDRTPGRARTSG
jgi:hypothetical protein